MNPTLGMEKVTALLVAPRAHIPGETLSEMEDGKIPANVEGSVAFTPKDSNGNSR